MSGFPAASLPPASLREIEDGGKRISAQVATAVNALREVLTTVRRSVLRPSRRLGKKVATVPGIEEELTQARAAAVAAEAAHEKTAEDAALEAFESAMVVATAEASLRDVVEQSARAGEESRAESAALRAELEEARRALAEEQRSRREASLELVALQARGSELCSEILGPPTELGTLLERMRVAQTRHAETAARLVTVRDSVASVSRAILGRVPSEDDLELAMSEAAGKYTDLEDKWKHLHSAASKACDQILGPLVGRARLTERLEGVVAQSRQDVNTRREAEAKLRAAKAAAAPVRGLVLGDVAGSSNLAATLDQIGGRMDIGIREAASNGVRWGTWTALSTVVYHYPVVGDELDLVGAGLDPALPDEEVDAL